MVRPCRYPGEMSTVVVPLRSRRATSALPALILISVLSVPVAVCIVIVIASFGPAPPSVLIALLGGIALTTLGPILLARNWMLLRRPAELAVRADQLKITHPQALRRPLVVPRTSLRAAVVDAEGRTRFRVRAASWPSGTGLADGFVWIQGWSALPLLAPSDGDPNVLLLFDPPVANAEPRWRGMLRGVFRGEQLAGLLLVAEDPRQAEDALGSLGVVRSLTMPDVFTAERNHAAGEGGRKTLGLRRWTALGWALVAVGLLPGLTLVLFAAVGAYIGVQVARAGWRGHGGAIAVAGLGAFAFQLLG
jgi:hypothetical protein